MILRKQLFRHEPENEIYGDCHRTAIACLLDKEPWEVPHFGQLSITVKGYNWRDGQKEYLASQGLAMVELAFENLEFAMQAMENWNPDLYWLLGGESPRGTNHTVICRGGNFYHDPHKSGGFVVAPLDTGMYEIGFLVPLSMTGKRS